MWRSKEGASASAGDWSQTGTFLRKPPTGWLHEDSELTNNSFIDYEVTYLGCIEVKESMRTLQFNVRTQVTKEAILRLAESTQRVFMGQKKRKVPKQINKVLGAVDCHSVGDVTLSVSVEALKISSFTGSEIMTHSLPSISFASGGDGPTADFIGYVAKDPVHNRACHVFECPNSSQYVLATIGQAFELRYKIYLQGPRSNAQASTARDNVQRLESRAPPLPINTEHVVQREATPPPSYEGLGDSQGIYSDIPDIPTTQPPPLPVPRNTPAENPYNNIDSATGAVPMGSSFPSSFPDIEAVPSKKHNGQTPVTVTSRLGNPYDTFPSSVGGEAVYSDPGEVTTTASPFNDDYDESIKYGQPLVSIKQISQTTEPDTIDLTPAQKSAVPLSHDYSNVSEDGLVDGRPIKPPRPIMAVKSTNGGSAVKPKPKPNIAPKPSVPRQQPLDDAIYDDPEALENKLAPTRPGCYDDVEDILPGSAATNVYDDVSDQLAPTVGSLSLQSPKFDDNIYDRVPGSENELDGIDALAPLPRQPYFHSRISRVEAEALLTKNGEFLVRESTKKPGQYVLTGMASGRAQHLLLMDKQGKVKSKDREFSSIPDLVRYFREKQSALVIGESQVYLRAPVINAFLPLK